MIVSIFYRVCLRCVHGSLPYIRLFTNEYLIHKNDPRDLILKGTHPSFNMTKTFRLKYEPLRGVKWPRILRQNLSSKWSEIQIPSQGQFISIEKMMKIDKWDSSARNIKYLGNWD